MSLASDITLLVSRTNALISTFDGKKEEIDSAVAQAIALGLSPMRYVFVDAINGSDAAVGTDIAPVQTFDRALEIAADFTGCRIYLLSDVALTKRHLVMCQYLEIGGVTLTGATGGWWPEQKRTVTWAAEAPPAAAGQRQTPAIVTMGRVVRLRDVSIPLPTPPVGVSVTNMIDFPAGGALLIESSDITAANPATTAKLATVWPPAQLVFGVTGTTIAASAKGHVLGDVAANGDPNTLWQYRSNLTSL